MKRTHQHYFLSDFIIFPGTLLDFEVNSLNLFLKHGNRLFVDFDCERFFQSFLPILEFNLCFDKSSSCPSKLSKRKDCF
jgi:hypothetical protein